MKEGETVDIKTPITINPLNDVIAQQSKQWESTLDAINKMNREKAQHEAESRQAAIETAENTAEMKADLKDVIHNQNDYIRLLRQNIQVLSDQLDM